MYFDLAIQQAYLASGVFGAGSGWLQDAWCSAEQLFSPKWRDFVREGLVAEA
jgi:hypothetical protein